MKVTYTQNRFEIDGVEIINPEVLPFHDKIIFYLNEFPLPENIIAEKIYIEPDDSIHCNRGVDKYRLKLKEPLVDELFHSRAERKHERFMINNLNKSPLVDTGSKEMSKFSNSEIGSIHWARTVLSYNLRVGEYLNDHGNAPSDV